MGPFLADNLVLMLFFWEGLLLTLFGLIAIGGKEAFKTATKAFIIVGISDLCLMVGIGLTGYLAKTLTISQINVPDRCAWQYRFYFYDDWRDFKSGVDAFPQLDSRCRH